MATLNEIVQVATAKETFHAALEVLLSLHSVDPYVSDLLTVYLKPGEASLYTMLMAVAQSLPDEEDVHYFEIGVRKGFSMALFAHECRDARITGVDLWADQYQGDDNPGPGLVQTQLEIVRHRGQVILEKGDSHELLVAQFDDKQFNVMTVDGDHSELGADADLRWAIQHVLPGGFILFDDISHPAHLYLKAMWDERLGDHADFDSWLYDASPNGIAIAQRKLQ